MRELHSAIFRMITISFLIGVASGIFLTILSGGWTHIPTSEQVIFLGLLIISFSWIVYEWRCVAKANRGSK